MISSFAVKPSPFRGAGAGWRVWCRWPAALALVGGPWCAGRPAIGPGRGQAERHRPGQPAHRAGARRAQGRRRRGAEARHVGPRRRPRRDLGQRPRPPALHRQRRRCPCAPTARSRSRPIASTPQQPASSEVRLQVDHGITRSISGRATEVDKNRFRLNTPVAAIGVRGTDFIVQATDVAHARHGGRRRHRRFGARRGLQRGRPGALCRRRQPPALGRHAPPDGGSAARRARCPAGARGQVTRHRRQAGAEDRMAATRAAETAARSAGLQAAEPHGRNDSAAAETCWSSRQSRCPT